jgi:hypothetical protein
MSIENPQTLREWSLYAARYKGVTLRSKVININTMAFADELLSEGKDMEYIKNVVLIFVRRMAEVGMHPPLNGSWDLDHMMKTDPVARKFWLAWDQMKEDIFEEIEEGVGSYYDPRTEPDELDLELS